MTLGQAREMLFVSLARGVPEDGPYWRTPAGGKIEMRWMERLGAYRFTLDLIPPQPWPDSWSQPPAPPLREPAAAQPDRQERSE